MTSTNTHKVANATRKEATMATTLTHGTAVVCTDQVGSIVQGVIVDVMEGEARGGGIAIVKGIWPGNKRASDRFVELADVEAVA
jgi:hypothetical protein